jgi:uncharacterized protein (DUF952 family)
MAIIFHVTTAEQWRLAKAQGYYETPSLKTEGFIHCSEAHQVAGVLERYFNEKSGLVKLVIDTNQLTSRYVQEWSPSTQDTYPHIYGPLNLDAVTEVIAI